MRKKLAIALAVLMVLGLSGMAMADNVATVNQSSNDNWVYIEQSGNNYADIDQIATDANRAEVHQATGTGYSYHAEITQTAETYNDALVKQATPGGPGTVKINQMAVLGYNEATVDYKTGWFYDTDVDINQQASLYNEAYVEMYGAVSYGRVVVDQNAPYGYNTINVESQHGTMITQAFSNGSISTAMYPALPAVQYSAIGNNDLEVNQFGDGVLGLYQNGAGNNIAVVNQFNGGNSVGAYQYAPNGYNVLDVTQYGDASATIVQTSTGGYNDLYISQSAGSSAIVSQTATTGNNIVSIIQ